MGEGGILQGGVDSGMTPSGAVVTLVVAGAMAGVSSEARVSLWDDTKAQVEMLERVINVLIRTELGKEVVIRQGVINKSVASA